MSTFKHCWRKLDSNYQNTKYTYPLTQQFLGIYPTEAFVHSDVYCTILCNSKQKIWKHIRQHVLWWYIHRMDSLVVIKMK